MVPTFRLLRRSWAVVEHPRGRLAGALRIVSTHHSRRRAERVARRLERAQLTAAGRTGVLPAAYTVGPRAA